MQEVSLSCNKSNDHRSNGEFWLMLRLAKLSPRVVFDIGANEGKWSLEALQCFPDAQIFAFEPVPATFKKLSENLSAMERVRKYPLALSDSKSKIVFHVYDNTNLFSSMYEHPSGKGGYEVEVDSIAGDKFCTDSGLVERIDFLKIDVEGAEHKVLQGFHQMLAEAKIRVIQFEYGIVSIETKFLLKDFFTFFEQHNYIIGKIYPHWVEFRPYNWTMENFIGPNYVAIRKDDAELLSLLTIDGISSSYL